MVIQRWQSVLLLITTIMMVIFSFCQIGEIQGSTVTVNLSAIGCSTAGDNPVMLQNNIYVAVVCWLSAVLSLIAIFFFKNTRLQKKVCWLCIVLIIAATASEWLAVNGLDVSGAEGISWNAVVCAPFIALAALIGAIRCIRSDEKKLSSYDRLR